MTGGPLQEGHAWYGADAPGKVEQLGPDNHADHLAAISGAEEADRAAGRRVACPTLVLWSSRDDLEELHGDPRPIWTAWTDDLRGGGPIDSGHHMAEEAPDALVSALAPFLRS